MKNTIKGAALSALVLALAVSGPAFADQAETKGGIKVKTDDGRFEANVGGRIHFDINVFDADANSFATAPAATGSRLTPNNSAAYLRRVYFTLKGKAYGWNYKIEPDLANNTQSGATTIAFQDITVSTDVLGGEFILGQFKPYRSMEDLTSSNDLLLIERPYTSSNGLFAGREFQQGVGYKYPIIDGLLAEASVFDLRSSTSAANAGIGYNARVAYAPFFSDGQTLHVGANYSYENTTNSSAVAPGTAVNTAETESYAGRRGPTLGIGSTAGSQPAKTFGGELAGDFGPVFFQSEYVSSTLKQLPASTPSSAKVEAFYVQAAWAITGESKPYKKADGVFGSVKPFESYGAFEVTARYDSAKNKDIAAGKCSITTNAGAVTPANEDKCQVSTVTAGLNWYANPNVRFMFNYVKGKADLGAAGTDKPTAYVLRTQFSF